MVLACAQGLSSHTDAVQWLVALMQLAMRKDAGSAQTAVSASHDQFVQF
jgi:hypothetical protein